MIVGVLVVGFVGIQQLGGKATGTLQDPAIRYPTALLHNDERAIGNSDAAVTLDVYEDYQCPICAQFSLSVEPILVSQYVTPGTLRIVHHDIAILGRGGSEDESKLAATGAACAVDQGKYFDYDHWVFNNQDGENQGGFRRQRLTAIAEAAGLDGPQFETCLDSASAIQTVTDTTNQAIGLGINSTPTMYIGDQQIVGLKTAQELGALIEAAAASAAPASPAASDAASPAASDAASPSTAP